MRRSIGAIGVSSLVLATAAVVAQERKADPPGVEAKKFAKKKAEVVKAIPAVRMLPLAGFAAPAAINVNLEQLVAQFTQQFRPTLTTELQLVKTACRPSSEQYRAIRRASSKALKEVATQYAEWQRDARQGKGRALTLNPNQHIQDGVAAAVRAHATPEQAERYRAELAARAEDQKRTAIQNMIANLDRDLILAPEQRERLGRSLAENWNDAWCPSLDNYIYDNQFPGNVPEQFVLPILSPAQRDAWRGNRNAPRVFFGSVIGTIQAAEEEPLDDEETGPAEAVDAVLELRKR